MDKSAAAIVDSAYLPLSIIIIGIGNADFGKMEYLDGDNGLIDSEGRKAKRDLVQFVPFNKFKGNPAKLAESVLEELPTQLCEYMRLVGLKPDPPQVVDINNMKFSTQQSLPNIPPQNPNPLYNLGQNLANAGFMNKIINQQYPPHQQFLPPQHSPGMSNQVNQMPIGLNMGPENPSQQQKYGVPPQFGSFAQNYGQSPQNIPQQGYGSPIQQPPQGYNNQQPPQGYNGQNTMPFGQNFGTGFTQQPQMGGPPPNYQNPQFGNNQQAGMSDKNIFSPSGRYNYGN